MSSVPQLVRQPRRLPGAVRAAWWTALGHREVRRALAKPGIKLALISPERIPSTETRAVRLTLQARRATCLERSLVLQEWFRAHGAIRDVVIGVRHDGSTKAHAWLEGVEPSQGYLEIHRLPVGATRPLGTSKL